MANTAGRSPADRELEQALQALARQRAEKKRGPSSGMASTEAGHHLTDRGNGLRLADWHGADLRHVGLWKKWLVWDSARWRVDGTGEVTRRAKDITVRMFGEAVKGMQEIHQELKDLDAGDDDKREDALKARLAALQRQQAWALKSEDVKRIKAMEELAKSDERIAIWPAALDRDPWLLNCPNGTLDLRTGQLRQHRQEDLITRLCPTPFEPTAACPLWEQTVKAIFASEDELVGYFQRLTGYCLTGVVREAMLPIFWGSGSNGKTLLFKTVREVVGGEYSSIGAEELLVSTIHKPHPTFLADLFGKRLVTLEESEDGGRLNEALIKRLTDGGKIKARRMHEDFWEFDPTHKIWLATNHKPEVRGTDHGIWRRLRLLPFTVRFWDPDKGEDGPLHLRADKMLDARLAAEAPGILAWMVRGCLEWQAGGLREPEEVQLATASYRSEQDVLARFIRERCEEQSGRSCRAGQLYKAYVAWHEDSGERGKPMSLRKFGEAIEEKGYEKKTSNGVYYLGIHPAPDIPWEAEEWNT